MYILNLKLKFNSVEFTSGSNVIKVWSLKVMDMRRRRRRAWSYLYAVFVIPPSTHSVGPTTVSTTTTTTTTTTTSAPGGKDSAGTLHVNGGFPLCLFDEMVIDRIKKQINKLQGDQMYFLSNKSCLFNCYVNLNFLNGLDVKYTFLCRVFTSLDWPVDTSLCLLLLEQVYCLIFL